MHVTQDLLKIPCNFLIEGGNVLVINCLTKYTNDVNNSL